MITEAIISGIINGILSIIGNIMNGALNAIPNKPDYQFGVPQPLWFMVSYITLNVALIYPLVLTYWVWRQIKS